MPVTISWLDPQPSSVIHLHMKEPSFPEIIKKKKKKRNSVKTRRSPLDYDTEVI